MQRRQPLRDEPAFGSHGHDDGVLDHLCLHQAEDLGAEVLPAIRPADSAACDLAGTQVHSFDPRAVHEHLVRWSRRRQVRDARGVELEGEPRLGSTVGVELVVVRPHGRADEDAEPAQHPVLVEAGNLLELLVEQLAALPHELVTTAIEIGVESGPEHVDDETRCPRVGAEGVLVVGLAEGAADLAEVAAVRPKHGDFPPREARGQHEGVEAVALGVAFPRRDERLLEGMASVTARTGASWEPQPEVVDPRSQAAITADLVGPLVHDGDPEIVEQRQHVGERDRLACAEQLHPHRALVGFEGSVEVDRQARPETTLEPVDVVDSYCRSMVLTVGARKRVAVEVEQLEAGGFAVVLHERCTELLAPPSGDVGDTVLERVEVNVDDRRRVGEDDHVHARQDSAADLAVEHALRGVVGVEEQILDAPTDLGAVTISRHEHEARGVPAIDVSPGEQLDPLAFPQVQDALGDPRQVIDIGVEQLVAWITFENRQQRRTVVSRRTMAEPFEDRLDLAPHHGDIEGGDGVDR